MAKKIVIDVITKIKIKDIVEIWYKVEKSNDSSEVKFSSPRVPHSDFVKAFSTLKDSFVSTMEFDESYGDNVEVTGLSMSYSPEGDRSVIISGKKELFNGTTCFNTPKIVSNIELENKILEIETEAYKYMFEGKEAQEKINFEEGI